VSDILEEFDHDFIGCHRNSRVKINKNLPYEYMEDREKWKRNFRLR
jgi:hypothetical protein